MAPLLIIDEGKEDPYSIGESVDISGIFRVLSHIGIAQLAHQRLSLGLHRGFAIPFNLSAQKDRTKHAIQITTEEDIDLHSSDRSDSYLPLTSSCVLWIVTCPFNRQPKDQEQTHDTIQ